MTDTSTVPRRSDGGKPGGRPLVDDELADRLLGRAQAEGVELLGPDGLSGRFAAGDSVSEIARELRVTSGSVRRWRRAWAEGGIAALRSKGPVSAERLSPAQWARLEAELRQGPLAHGFADDQRWTLVRVKTLIGRLFHVGYTVQGTRKLLRRHGWSCQIPVRQAMERDEAAIAVWKAEVWPEIKHRPRPGRLRLLRGRGRPGAEAAEGTHLGAARRPARGECARWGRRPG